MAVRGAARVLRRDFYRKACGLITLVGQAAEIEYGNAMITFKNPESRRWNSYSRYRLVALVFIGRHDFFRRMMDISL